MTIYGNRMYGCRTLSDDWGYTLYYNGSDGILYFEYGNEKGCVRINSNYKL